MTTKRIKLKNATGDYLEPYTTNVPDASSSTKGLVQTEETPTANSTKVLTSGGAKTALDGKLDTTATAAKATADASGNTITTTYATKTELSGVETQISSVRNVAEGRSRAVSFTNYADLVSNLNTAAKADYKIGDNIFIQAQEVPDLWVYSVEEEQIPFTYTDDASLADALKTVSLLQIGYYKVAALETEKVDLSGYVPTSRSVNNKVLSGNISLNYSDVGALAAGGTAVRATADASGNNIIETYATKAEIITFEEME